MSRTLTIGHAAMRFTPSGDYCRAIASIRGRRPLSASEPKGVLRVKIRVKIEITVGDWKVTVIFG
jgi:hypothetical protein